MGGGSLEQAGSETNPIYTDNTGNFQKCFPESGNLNTVLGYNATSSYKNSVVIGNGAGAGNQATTAVGAEANAIAIRSTAIGRSTTANDDGSIAIGCNATATGIGSIAIGYNATLSDSTVTYAIRIGTTDKGSSCQPIYLNAGVVTACDVAEDSDIDGLF